LSQILIILSILLPLAGGALFLWMPVTAELYERAWCECVTILTSLCVWMAILGGRADSFTIYSFTNGFAINFHMDGLSMLFAGMISVMWPLVTLYAFEYMKDALHKRSFFAFYVMTYGITLGIAFSGDILTMYVFYEMLTLITIPLVSHYQDHDSMYAGRVYAAYVIGGAAAAFITVVITTLRMGGMFSLAGSSFAGQSVNLMLAVYVIGFFGFGVKAAVFPLHYWLPTATAAPTPVTALLHAVAVVNSGVFAIMRLTYYIYGAGYLRGTWAQHLALGTAAFTLVFAAVCAMRERHLKRRLAYSTVSNLSYMLFGTLLLTQAGFTAGMAHMLFHGIIKMSLFLCAGAVIHVTGKSWIYQLNGLGKKMPWTFAFYTLGALSLTGVPMFAGFVSKWRLLTAAAAAGTGWSYAGAACLIAGAFFCAMYTLTVSIRAFFPMKGTDLWSDVQVTDPNWRMLVPIGFFAAANLYFGIWPGQILRFLGTIASGVH